jgi:hypothetical protein
MKLLKGSKHYLLAFFIALALALTLCPSTAQAQIDGDLEANISFPFHAGNAKFPAGRYIVRFLEDSDHSVMEISSADGRTSALFEVQTTQVGSTPVKDELVFNKYGNRYFLAKLFEEGSATGNEVVESRYEKRVDKATVEAQEHVPAHRRRQRAS